MGIYQQQLPQLNGLTCITDGGLETDMIFNKNLNLPEFAAYSLLQNEEGYAVLFDYYKDYAQLARKYKLGLVLETPTWRASADWARKLGDSQSTLRELNIAAVELIGHVRDEFATSESPIIISGNIGPRGDGYTPENLMSAQEAQNYHLAQIESFSECEVDLISALTLNYVDEAIGITQASLRVNIPICIAFTVETDGKLPTGETLEAAIKAVDEATDAGPVYYMINCAHPSHFSHLLSKGGEWLKRLGGIRANASCMSHEELDNSEVLDDGHPGDFGKELKAIHDQTKSITVLGGCCGTDTRHIEEICINLSKQAPL
ncbi:MAG: homocysteine S-methyltransferase [Gammaproteobacteria bacterium]|nr:homocysteine S-methyltransferase [Gammaproteobacteria bacterium]